ALGDLRFYYVGASEKEDKNAVLRTRRRYLLRHHAIQAAHRELEETPVFKVRRLRRCRNLLEAYIAERAWIKAFRSRRGNKLLNRNRGGRLRLGTWSFLIGTERLDGFLSLSRHRANVFGLDPQKLKYRIEVLGWTLPQALWSSPKTANRQVAKRGTARIVQR